MQEYLIPLSVAAAAAGLVVAGVNIAKGKRKMVSEERFEIEISDIKKDVSGLGRRVSNIENDMVTKEVFEKRMDKTDSKLDAVRDGLSEDMREVFRFFGRFEATIEEWRNK